MTGTHSQPQAPDADVEGRIDDLLRALEAHRPGAGASAKQIAGWAFVCASELGLERERAELVRFVAGTATVGLLYGPPSASGVASSDAHASESAPPRPFEVTEAAAESAALAVAAGLDPSLAEWIARLPEGREGPLESRIVLAALTAASAPTAVAAAEELERGAGSSLDPRVAEALARAIERAAAERT